MEKTLSHPVTVTDEYLAAILAQLQEIREVLARPVTVLNMPAEETDFLGGGTVGPPAPRSRRRKALGG